jgi:hypothetical protein
MLHGSSVLHYSLSVRVLLIGILVHLISLLNVNEELCISFALLNHYWCYVIKSSHPLLFAFCCIVLVVGDLIIWPFKLKDHCSTFNLPPQCQFHKAWWKVSANLWVVVTHDKALKQGRYQSSTLPLAVALGRRLKVTTYGKALRQGHYENSTLPSAEVGRHLILVMTPSVGLTYQLKQPSTTYSSCLVVY